MHVSELLLQSISVWNKFGAMCRFMQSSFCVQTDPLNTIVSFNAVSLFKILVPE